MAPGTLVVHLVTGHELVFQSFPEQLQHILVALALKGKHVLDAHIVSQRIEFKFQARGFLVAGWVEQVEDFLIVQLHVGYGNACFGLGRQLLFLLNLFKQVLHRSGNQAVVSASHNGLGVLVIVPFHRVGFAASRLAIYKHRRVEA